jgi:dipeptide transport system substrate-binding protein
MRHFLRLAASLGLAAGACGAHAAGVLTFCAEASPNSFDAAQTVTLDTDIAVGMTLYDRLLDFKPGTTELQPGLAKSWEFSPDGRTLTLHLRSGVKFGATAWFKPTRDMDADDVVWSLQRLFDNKSPGHAIAPGGYPYWDNENLSARIRAIAKVDAATVRIELAKPDSSVLAELALPASGTVYSAEYAQRLIAAGKLAQFAQQPVGTGPFTLRSAQKDAVIRYAANPSYWRGAPQVEQLVFAITPDPAVRVQRIRAGECAVGRVPLAEAGRLAAEGLSITRVKALGTSYVLPNANRPFLSDKRFRNALSLALDRASLIRTIYDGQGQVAGALLPPPMWGHDPSIANAYDPAQARALVKASGYDGRELVLLMTANDHLVQRSVEMMMADWAKAGIKVVPRSLESNELFARIEAGDGDLSFISWYADNGDPDNFLSQQLACAGTGGTSKYHWCSAAFDKLLADARATTDIAARTALYHRAQAMIHDEAAEIPLAYANSAWAMGKRVSGVVVTPFLTVDFRDARLQ